MQLYLHILLSLILLSRAIMKLSRAFVQHFRVWYVFVNMPRSGPSGFLQPPLACIHTAPGSGQNIFPQGL